jgi:protoporphyrinogen oxidase
MTNATQNAAPAAEQCDAIVIGANLAGLVISYFLTGWGYSVRTIERAPFIGGSDRSFRNANGRLFDFGVHSLDYMRSEFTTHLVIQAIDAEIVQMERKRGIVHRDTLIPYNADKSEWPAELAAMMPEGELVDELGTDRPTRENLARYYGKEFADYIFEETLASYPAEFRHLSFGVEEWELMKNIYPWFFPRARRTPADIDASRIFHDRARGGRREDLVYPKEGGFGSFAASFARKVQERGSEIITGAGDLHVELDPDTREVLHVATGGRRFVAPRVYWCASAESLGDLLGAPCAETQTETFVLGSFEFERPVQCEYTEILFGDPEHLVNRASFPGKFSKTKDNLVQLEFAYPRHSDQHETKESYWLEKWVTSLQRLGIVQPSNAVVDFDLKTVPMMYNSYGVDGVAMPEVDFSDVLPETSNLRPVLPTIRKININTRLPQYLEFLTADLLGRR